MNLFYCLWAYRLYLIYTLIDKVIVYILVNMPYFLEVKKLRRGVKR